MNEENKNSKKHQEDASSKEVVGKATEGLIDHFTGGHGGQIYEKAKKTPILGDKIDNLESGIAKGLNKNTGGNFGKAANKMNNLTKSPNKRENQKNKLPNNNQAPKNNVGRKNLVNNNNIARPATNSLTAEKEKNQNKLQEQLQKNAIRSIANAFAPKIGGKIVDRLTKTKEEKEKDEETSTTAKSEEQDASSKSKSSSLISLTGNFSFEKQLSIIAAISSILFIIIIIIIVSSTSSFRFQDLIGVGSAGVAPDILGASGGDQKLIDLYTRIQNIQKEYAANNKNFSADLIAAVYHILTERNQNFTPEMMSEELIREIANYMFKETCIETANPTGNTIKRCNYTYSEEEFKNNLTNYFFPKFLKAEECSIATEEVFEYLQEYKELVGNTNPINMSSNGACSYEIPGFVIGGSVRPVNLSVSNLHVRLMQTAMFGGVDGQPIPDEELVEFEKYILGVSWGEFSSGNSEAEKAQLIAARSYALARPTVMGTTGGRGLIQENGQWILSLCNSVADQVYCDPDQGCSRDVSSGQNSQVYSGATKKITYKPALASDAILRVYASEVNGVVLTDNNDNVIYTPYNSTLQNDFKAKGDQGWDYVSILLSHYASLGATKVKQMSCSAGTSGGGYASWKQNDPRWGSITLGNSGKSIAQIGCLATSVAMQIASSGVTTSVQDFNPGTFVEAMNKLGGFAGGLLQWGVVSSIAGGFNYQGQIVLSGKNKAEKLNTISNMLNQGYYLVAEVKGTTGEHWVAISGVNGNNITMMDPGSQATNMWSQYDWNNTSRIGYFKVS